LDTPVFEGVITSYDFSESKIRVTDGHETGQMKGEPAHRLDEKKALK
jgi:hypothetical protein